MSEFVAPVNSNRAGGLRIAAGVIFLLLALARLFGFAINLTRNLTYINDAGSNWPWFIETLVSALLIGLACTAAGIFSFSGRKDKLVLQLGIGAFILGGPVSWIFQAIYYSRAGFAYNFLYAVVSLTTLSLVPVLLTAIAMSRAKFKTQTQPMAMPVLASNAAQGNPTLSNLPVFALVAAFVVPIAAVILGHISLGQMNRGQISNQNHGQAVAGLVLGYVFMFLSFIATIFLIIYWTSRSNY